MKAEAEVEAISNFSVTEPEALWTIEDVINFLGGEKKPATILRWARAGKIPAFFKISNREVRFKPSEFYRWSENLAAHLISTTLKNR